MGDKKEAMLLVNEIERNFEDKRVISTMPKDKSEQMLQMH